MFEKRVGGDQRILDEVGAGDREASEAIARGTVRT
jgi:hypothetical protein